MFIDAYPPLTIMKFGFVSSPRFSSTMTQVASGAERRNQNWAHPLHRFVAPEAIECHEDLVALHNMWMVMAGPVNTFAFRDPLDFASRDLPAADVPPAIGPTDQVLAIGDGVRKTFQLVRSYAFGGQAYERPIYHPIVDSVEVALNALPPEQVIAIPGSLGPPVVDPVYYSWTVSRSSGLVTFNEAPLAGMVVTAGFLFDVEARFEADDSYDGIVRSWRVSGHADLTFFEVRPC